MVEELRGAIEAISLDEMVRAEAVSRRAAKGSQILLDHVPCSMVDGTREYHGAKENRAFLERMGEPVLFGVDDGRIGELLGRHGFSLVSDVGAKDLEQRYLIRSDGELRGRVIGFVRIAHAAMD